MREFSTRAFLDIELKVAGLRNSALIGLLRKHPPLSGYVVSSFLPEALTAVQRLDGVIPLGFLCDEEVDGADGNCRWRGRFRSSTWWDRELVERAHGAGTKIMVWTVNRVDEMRRLAEWGVDAIISDETELLVRHFVNAQWCSSEKGSEPRATPLLSPSPSFN